MTITASIIFCPGSAPENFTIHGTEPGGKWHWPSPDDRQFTGHTWPLLADDRAVELWPLCKHEAWLVDDSPPAFDGLEVYPVTWGYPDSLIADHPAEVEQMRQDHLAAKHELVDGNYLWPVWLEAFGKDELWRRFHTAEMERCYLNWQTGPGATLHTFAGLKGRIPQQALKCIRFRADFHQGDICQTIYLYNCAPAPLTFEELNHSPAHLARLEQLEVIKARNIAQGAAVAQQPTTAAGRARKARALTIKTSKSKKPHDWHSEDFTVIFRRNSKGTRVVQHPLTYEFRAVVQLLNEQPEQNARFSRIEPLISARIRELEIADGRSEQEATPARIKRRLRQMLRSKEGQKLRKWGVLVVQPVGRQKFLRLSPPAPLK